MLYGIYSPFSGVSFKPQTDIPDLSGKVVLITGGNVGLGKETIRQLLLHNPSKIYLAARTASKAHSCIQDLLAQFPSSQSPAPSITFIQCDLSSLKSVQTCAREFVSKETRLDILLLNAGVMAIPPGTTEDGYEIQFGTNHVGHALLTKLLMPTLRRTATATTADVAVAVAQQENSPKGAPEKEEKADVRIVAVSSIGHIAATGIGIPFADLKSDMSSYLTMRRYAVSKLANILFVKELARREEQLGNDILAVAVHPGTVNTELYNTYFGGWGPLETVLNRVKGVFLTGLEEGARNQLWAATAARGERGGKMGVGKGEYYTPVGVAGNGSVLSEDRELAKRLWEWTEEELKGWEL